MVYKALLWADTFWISYIDWYKFYNNNLSIVAQSTQGRTLKLVNPKLSQSDSLSVLTFLFTLPRYQVSFQWKQTKEKLGNALSAWRNFHIDLTWRMGIICHFFQGFFQELSRLHIFFRLSIFAKEPTGKFIHAS